MLAIKRFEVNSVINFNVGQCQQFQTFDAV